MTSIVAVSQNKICYIGGDSAGSNSRNGEIGGRVSPKVFERNGYLFGYTTSFRMGDILEFRCPIPSKKELYIDLRRHLITNWIPTLRRILRDEGFIQIDKNVERGGTFIVGYKGEICMIYDDLQVGIPSDGYAAVGSGTPYALGALYATKNLNWMGAEERVKLALAASAYHNAYVREPFIILKS